MNGRESMTHTQDINNKNDQQKKYRLETVSKNILLAVLIRAVDYYTGKPNNQSN